MKKTFSISVICISLMMILASCGSGDFASLKGHNGIQVVHVPWLLCKFAASYDDSKSINGIRSIDVATAYNPKDSLALVEKLNEIVLKDNLELILQAEDLAESVSIYGHTKSGSKKIKDVIIFSREKGENNIVRLKGTFDIEDFEAY